jgi:hypothetical protein
MKFNPLERVLVVSCAAVFLLAIADEMEISAVCPASGPGSCTQAAAPAEAVQASRRESRDVADSLELCGWEERARDEQLRGLTVSVPSASHSKQGIPCPVEAARHFAKDPSRLESPLGAQETSRSPDISM